MHTPSLCTAVMFLPLRILSSVQLNLIFAKSRMLINTRISAFVMAKLPSFINIIWSPLLNDGFQVHFSFPRPPTGGGYSPKNKNPGHFSLIFQWIPWVSPQNCPWRPLKPLPRRDDPQNIWLSLTMFYHETNYSPKYPTLFHEAFL